MSFITAPIEDDTRQSSCTSPCVQFTFTKEGAEGGYALDRPATEITLRAVAEATGTTFVKVNWTPGDVHEDCLFSSLTAEALSTDAG